MSVSKWAYTPEKCDGDYCCGDCDHCDKTTEFERGFHEGAAYAVVEINNKIKKEFERTFVKEIIFGDFSDDD